MSTSSIIETTPTTIDIESIVRQVLQRLRSATVEPVPSDAVSIADRVVTLKSIDGLPDSVRRITLLPKAVVTPAVKDECRRRGIQISDQSVSNQQTGSQKLTPANLAKRLINLMIDDDASGDRKRSMVRQLNHRGISVDCKAERLVHISTQPAAATWKHAASGQKSVLISRHADIDRFHAELDCSIHVVDATHMNFMQQINACIRIAGLTPAGERS